MATPAPVARSITARSPNWRTTLLPTKVSRSTRGRRGWGSAVGRFSGDFGAVAGDGAEGCPLLLGTKDADRVAGFQRQVCTWVWDHLVPPHDGQDGRPGLPPHGEVSHGVTEEATLG